MTCIYGHTVYRHGKTVSCDSGTPVARSQPDGPNCRCFTPAKSRECSPDQIEEDGDKTGPDARHSFSGLQGDQSLCLKVGGGQWRFPPHSKQRRGKRSGQPVHVLPAPSCRDHLAGSPYTIKGPPARTPLFQVQVGTWLGRPFCLGIFGRLGSSGQRLEGSPFVLWFW